MLKTRLHYRIRQIFMPRRFLRAKYDHFRQLLADDDCSMESIADLQDAFYSRRPMDLSRVTHMCHGLCVAVDGMIKNLQAMQPGRYRGLTESFQAISGTISQELMVPEPNTAPPYVLDLTACSGQARLAGGKGANLSRVAMETQLPVPPGVVVTTRSYHRFIKENDLRPELNAVLENMQPCKSSAFDHDCSKMQTLIRSGRVPEAVATTIQQQVERLCETVGQPNPRFAVRSSAWAEDGDSSFAGQYETRLQVPPHRILEAYRDVLASKYSRRAVHYRILRGLADPETPMAVVILPMIDARAAGVAYTEDTACKSCISVHATTGLADGLVAGRAEPDVFHLHKTDPPEIIGSPTASPSLDLDTAKNVAALSLELERRFGVAQDVEWAQDTTGRLWILQSRPFGQDTAPGNGADLSGVPPLIERLTPVAMGVASGPIVHFHDVQQAHDVPPGCIAVFEVLSPSLTRCLDRVAGVIGTSGGRASHFATVAREFGVPVMVGDPMVIADLEEAMVVTVNASTGTIYEGRLDGLLEEAKKERHHLRRIVSRRYETLIPLVTNLSVTDPESTDFAPSGCRSLHDLVRYCHEKGMQEMFSLAGRTGRGLGRAPKLETPLPLSIYVLDLESSRTKRKQTTIAIHELESLPFHAFWEGLEGEDTRWESGLHHADWEALDQVSAGIFSKDARFLSSYAIVDRDYMHVMIRFGYHFTALDSVCGTKEETNYINFRFKGGGADSEGRFFRLLFIKRVLVAYGFEISIRSDMLDAKMLRLDAAATRNGLHVLGRLLAQTRLMDMYLADQSQVETLVEEFLADGKKRRRFDVLDHR